MGIETAIIIASIAAMAGGIATTAISAANQPDVPEAQPAPGLEVPGESAAAQQAAAQAAAVATKEDLARRSNQKGAKQSILTSPSGLTDEASTAKKTLLGA